jgi:hypothetical protein
MDAQEDKATGEQGEGERGRLSALALALVRIERFEHELSLCDQKAAWTQGNLIEAEQLYRATQLRELAAIAMEVRDLHADHIRVANSLTEWLDAIDSRLIAVEEAIQNSK